MGAIEAKVGDAVVALDTSRLFHPGGKIFGNFAEDANLAFDDFLLLAVRHVSGHVVYQTLLGAFIKHTLVQGSWGLEVLRANLTKERGSVASELAMDLVEIDGALTEGNGFDGREVIGSGSLVVEGHVAVTLEVGDPVIRTGGVDGKLLIVDPNTMTVGIWIREETTLKYRVGRWLDPRYHMRRVESYLLNLREIVDSVFVQDKFANLTERELLLGPNVGKIEDVDALLLPKILGLLRGHGLPGTSPRGVITLFNTFVQVLLREVR